MDVWVLRSEDDPPGGQRDVLLLRHVIWNDWWEYETLHSVTYIDKSATFHHLGLIKIGQAGMSRPSGGPSVRPELPRISKQLPPGTFSVGQDPEYYENVNKLGASLRTRIHNAVRDVAADSNLFTSVMEEDVLQRSLLRDIPARLVSSQFARMARGGARLTDFDFVFIRRETNERGGIRLEFSVEPETIPPTNIHAVVGRNGVGKSTLLNEMARHLVQPDSQGEVQFASPDGTEFNDFNNVVSVSYSAFDEFPALERTDVGRIGYSYIGLRDQRDQSIPSRLDQLAPLTDAIRQCLFTSRRERLLEALSVCENDPIFETVGLVRLIKEEPNQEILDSLRDNIYPRLSAGHKIVLLSLARLVATVEEKTLVLIDEPEAHLHPPLLSAYIRALSGLLIDRNAVAIIATHSPVVLQELPASCVWKLSRIGRTTVAERSDTETFGENVGTLTNEVFGLEVTATGFHQILTDLVENGLPYQAALLRLGNQLGLEGRAILRARIAQLDREDSETDSENPPSVWGDW